MHTVVKKILPCLALLLVASGCQSGAGSGSWKWWGGAQNVKPDSQSALAGTPYDGVELPSQQVQPPRVETGEPAPKKTLATLPPGTPTSKAYASTATPAAHNVSPDNPASRYPSTPYPATAYPSTPYPNEPNAAGQTAVADATRPGPTRVAGVPPQRQQPTYPTTSFGPGVPPSAVAPRSEPPATVGTYPFGPGSQQNVSTPRAEPTATPPSVTSPLGPRYNST
ncbi:MAG: hypothetical protein P8K78_09750, partial [Pirellulales bacterium]|nr:hypothetical protein [Pirellulales bacterium]